MANNPLAYSANPSVSVSELLFGKRTQHRAQDEQHQRCQIDLLGAETKPSWGTIPLTVFRPFSISRFLIRANGPRR